VPFPPKLLNDNEQVVLDLKPHWWFMVGSTLALVGSIIVALLVLAWFDVDVLKYGGALLVLFCLAYFGYRYVKWTSMQFVVTTERVIHREGIVAKKGIEIPLERINTVFFNQSIFERILGAGDLGIESAGERGSETFTDVRKPSLVQNEIYRQMEANSNRMHQGGPAATQPAAASIPEQIEQLDQLRQRGVISEQEFAAKKADLLNRM
jgi:uncharacterized membrane protein YdbT with pleckstrin-like domain